MEPLQIDSKTEETYFFNLIQQNAIVKVGAWHHVGGLQLGDDWKWKSDLSEVLPSLKWAPSQRNDLNAEHCLSIWKAHSWLNTGLNDVKCKTHRMGFFCQTSKNPKKMPSEPCEEVEDNSAKIVDLERQLAKHKTREQELEQELESQKAKKLDLNPQLESQMGVCKLLSQALDTMLTTGEDVSIDSTDTYNARQYKTVTVSVSSTAYGY